MKKIVLKGVLLVMLLYFNLLFLAAQGPSSLPGGTPEPLPFTLPNILIFIVLPVLLFIFYLWWLKQKRKQREEEMLRRKQEEGQKKQSNNHHS